MNKKNLGLGMCQTEGCTEWAIVGFNGWMVCETHMNQKFKSASKILKAAERVIE